MSAVLVFGNFYSENNIWALELQSVKNKSTLL